MKQIYRLFMAICAACVFTSASAWDGIVSGKVSQLEVTAGGNYGVRVTVTNAPGGLMCTGGATWAYLNETDSNYKVYVSVLLMARATGASVSVYSTRVGAYCQIQYLVLYNG